MRLLWPRLVAPLVVAAAVATSATAWAEPTKVAVLRFMTSGGTTTAAELEAARASTREAVLQIKDTLPTDPELASAEAAVKDHVPDTSGEFVAAGHASGSEWTLAGHVDTHGWTYRLELEACQVSTGRVESLAREIDARQSASQIAEMLALLLRPKGVGDAIPPWDQPSTPPSGPPAPPPAAPPPAAIAPPTPAPPATRPRAYAEEHPLALGLGGEVVSAYSRAYNARGASSAGLVVAHVAYANASVRGLELVGNVGVAVAGPSSFQIDAGVRYLLAIVPSAQLFAGPELAVGGFFALGGDKSARVLGRLAFPIVLGLGERWQIEGYPEIAYAMGGTTSIGLAGGGLRAVLRF